MIALTNMTDEVIRKKLVDYGYETLAQDVENMKEYLRKSDYDVVMSAIHLLVIKLDKLAWYELDDSFWDGKDD